MIEQALRERFTSPEWAIFFEVRNGTGFVRTPRSADAIAMSLWPSRGLELHGFEVKRSRADWLREKKDPAKADAIARYCDRWWLVVGDPEIVKLDELPPTWGLLAMRGKTLRCKREAPKLEAVPADRAFLAALLRRAHEASPGEEIVREAVAKARAEERERHEKELAAVRKQRSGDDDHYKKLIETFEKASGISITGGWNRTAKCGEAVRFVLDGGLDKLRRELAAHVEKVEWMALSCRAILDSSPAGEGKSQ